MSAKIVCLYVESPQQTLDNSPQIHLFSPAFTQEQKTPFPRGCVLVLGVMDGVHRGHQHLIQVGNELAQKEGRPLVVSTFVPHPATVLQQRQHFLLTLPEERLQLFDALGISYVLLFVFTEAFARLTPQQFVDEILGNTLQPAHIVAGENFRFGYRAQGSVPLLKTLTQALGITTHVLPLVQDNAQPISSSRIRHLIQTGTADTAHTLLGYPWFLTGKVIPGNQIGRLHFVPTANLQVPQGKLPIASGIYGGWVQRQADEQIYPAAIYVGQRPTITQHTDGNQPASPTTASSPRIEVHLLDFAGELYGEWLRVFVQFRIRSDARFPTLNQLARQIQQDIHEIRQRLGNSQTSLLQQITPQLHAFIRQPVRPVHAEPDFLNLCLNTALSTPSSK